MNDLPLIDCTLLSSPVPPYIDPRPTAPLPDVSRVFAARERETWEQLKKALVKSEMQVDAVAAVIRAVMDWGVAFSDARGRR